MKKGLFLLISLLLLSGCGDNSTITTNIDNTYEQSLLYQKQKDCFNAKNDFIDFLYKKHNIEKVADLSEKLDKRENKSFNFLNNDEEIFYSEYADKCIGAYRIIRYEPTVDNGIVVGYLEDEYYYIDDIINDKNLRIDGEISVTYDGQSYDELMEYTQIHNEKLRGRKRAIERYRTGKMYEEERTE